MRRRDDNRSRACNGQSPHVSGHPPVPAVSSQRAAPRDDPLSSAGPLTRQQAAVRQAKRARAQLEAACSTSRNSSSDSRAHPANKTDFLEPDAPIAKRTRSSLLPDCGEGNHGSTALPAQKPRQQQQKQQVDAATHQRQQRTLLFRAAEAMCDAPRRHEYLPQVLAAMLNIPDDEEYQLMALDAALAVETVNVSNMLDPFLSNKQLLPHLLHLTKGNSEWPQDNALPQAAHIVLCLVACRAARQSPAAAETVLQFLLSEHKQGLLYLLKLIPSSRHNEAHAALAAVANLAAAARFAEPASVATTVQQLYTLAMQPHNGLQLLLESLQQEHLAGLAAVALEGFAQTVPQQLLSDLLKPQQRRNLQHLLDALDSAELDVYGPLREATYLLMVAATAGQLQQLLQQLIRQVHRNCSVSAIQLVVLAGVHAGPAPLIPHMRSVLTLLSEPRGSPDYKQYIMRALQQTAQIDAGQQLLIHHGIPALVHCMKFCELDTAVAAASLICLLASSTAGRLALLAHIRGLLDVATLQRRSDITGIAVQCVGAILVFGSLSEDGNLMLSPASPGLYEIVQNVDLVLSVMQQESVPQEQQQAVGQQQQQQEVDQQQQQQAGHLLPEQGVDPDPVDHEPQMQQPPTADAAPPPPAAHHQQQLQQQDQPLLQIRPCASVSAAMIVNAIAVSPQGLHVLQQNKSLDRLLCVVQQGGPAATLAARAISQIIATAPDSRRALVAHHRLAFIHSLAAEIPKIAELGARAATTGPAALAAALAALNGEQNAAADVFRVAGPLVHLLTAAAACGVVPRYVGGLAKIMQQVPCLTMVIFEALTHLVTFRDGVLALAPHVHGVVAAVQHSINGPAGSAEAATVAGTASIAAVRGSFDKPAAARAVRGMVTAVETVVHELKQEQAVAEGRMQYAGVQLAAAMKQYRRWPRSKKRQATVMRLLQCLARASEVNSQLDQQLSHIKWRQPDWCGSICDDVNAAMSSVGNL